MRVVRLAEVPLQHLPEPLDVALGQGLVQVELGRDVGDAGRRGVGAEHRHRHVARQQVQEQVRKEGDDEEDPDELHQPAGE